MTPENYISLKILCISRFTFHSVPSNCVCLELSGLFSLYHIFFHNVYTGGAASEHQHFGFSHGQILVGIT